MSTFGYEEAADHYEKRRNDHTCIHQAPRINLGVVCEDKKADERAGDGANGLETECAQHEAPSRRARDAFGDDEVCRGVIAAERET